MLIGSGKSSAIYLKWLQRKKYFPQQINKLASAPRDFAFKGVGGGLNLKNKIA